MNDFRLPEIQFADLKDVMTKCGNLVVRGIIGCVENRQKPDGSGQKQNAESTIKRKGHDQPVVEKKRRFEKAKTYKVEVIDESKGTVAITIAAPEDSQIAAFLEEKGYDFFGITKDAEDRSYQLMDAYIVERVRGAFKK